MSLNDTPKADRIHIGIFGRRNAGKSSLINAMTGQDLAVVSDVAGTTTDPVSKAMELLPLGPVVMIDTPGIDDEGELGSLRVKKSYQVLNRTDIAVVAADAEEGAGRQEMRLLEKIREKQIPYVIAVTKSELADEDQKKKISEAFGTGGDIVFVSAKEKTNIYELKERIVALAPKEETKKIVGDMIGPADMLVLVVPIDNAAPKGRLILPQQQTIRDILDAGAMCTVTKEDRVRETLKALSKKPKMVITDSQAFKRVWQDTPDDVLLTSFSILMARYKGNLKTLVRGTAALDSLKDGSRVLISEGCTHHRQCGDIGTEKLPAWIRGYTGKDPDFEFTSGTGFPEDLLPYSLIVHCGGCMLNEREMKYRIKCAEDQDVPITNYGMCIAKVNGILERSLGPFPDIYDELKAVQEKTL